MGHDLEGSRNGEESRERDGRGGGVATILLVDDNHDSRAIYGRALLYFGFNVLEAGNGEDAIRIALEDRPQLIIMDLSIPRTDGLAATRILKSNEQSRDIPIIVLTAHALPEFQRTAEHAGCDGFLTKPCDPHRLIEEIRRFL